MFLRYLAVMGRCSPYLCDAIPTVAHWRQTTLPQFLPQEEVEKLVASCHPTIRAGLRDRAILLLLARLGLRARDIVNLRLSDIDWGSGSFRVAGKGRREASLPLSQEVGDALLAYIERDRPLVGHSQVFLTVRPPFRPFACSGTVAGAVKRAIDRAGVSAPTRGAHLLRHSAATAMLRDGASLTGIGIVLRHQSIETTTLYARVDKRLLQQIAQPWPEVAEC
jgi:site-specific recombinase XerD